MKKGHDARSLANELEGSSAFFHERQVATSTVTKTEAPKAHSAARPTIRPPDPSVAKSTKSSPDQSTQLSAGRPPTSSIDQPMAPQTQPIRRPARRTLQRRSFEFYVDQLETLRRWSLQSRLLDEGISMSEMIRTALDRYLRDEGSSHPPADDPTNRPPDPSGREGE